MQSWMSVHYTRYVVFDVCPLYKIFSIGCMTTILNMQYWIPVPYNKYAVFDVCPLYYIFSTGCMSTL